MQEAIAGSPDLRMASARLRKAQAYARQAGAALLPQIDATSSAGFVQQSENNGVPAQFVPDGWEDTAKTGLSISLDLDLWGKNRATLAAGVTAALHDPHKGPYFLAERDGAAVGQMAVTFEWSDWRNGWFWWIQSVYVRPEARRQGVFRALFEHVQEAARADPGVIGLRLYVLAENRRAQETYLRCGMEETGYFVLEKFPL